MKNIIKTDKLIASYIIRILLTSVASILVMCFICSKIALALDLPNTYNNILSVIIFCVSAFIISGISIIGFKNNLFVLAVISIIPIIIFSLINVIFNSGSFAFFLIKLAVSLIICFIVSYIKSHNSKVI